MPMGAVDRVGRVASDSDGVVDAELGFATEPLARCLTLGMGHDVAEEAVGEGDPETLDGHLGST